MEEAGDGASVRRRYWEGGAVGSLGKRVDILGGITSKNSRRDLVDEALGKARCEQRTGWVWGRDEYNGVQDTLHPMQVRGGTQQYHRFTFHDAFAGIGAGTLGLEGSGWRCVGAFEQCRRARKVYESHSSVRVRGEMRHVHAKDWPAADVYLSGSPCQDFSIRGTGQGARGQRGRLMYTQLRLVKEAPAPYKVLVFETVPNFLRMHNGAEYAQFKLAVEELGYEVSSQVLFAPDYGSCSARRRLIIVGIRRDLHARVGPFHFPLPTSIHHPLHTILQPTFLRKEVRVWRSDVNWYDKPVQRGPKSLKLIGHIGRGRSGERVYSVDGFAATQTANGRGAGWGTGLYSIDGRVSRLTVREAARLQQLEDDIVLDEREAVARRQIGNSMPVGMVRAIGVEVGRYLAAVGEGEANVSKCQAPTEVEEQGGRGGAVAGGRHRIGARAPHNTHGGNAGSGCGRDGSGEGLGLLGRAGRAGRGDTRPASTNARTPTQLCQAVALEEVAGIAAQGRRGCSEKTGRRRGRHG